MTLAVGNSLWILFGTEKISLLEVLLILKEGVLKLRFFKSYFKSLPVTPSSRNILRSLGGFLGIFLKIFPNEEEEGVNKPKATVSDGHLVNTTTYHGIFPQ